MTQEDRDRVTGEGGSEWENAAAVADDEVEETVFIEVANRDFGWAGADDERSRRSERSISPAKQNGNAAAWGRRRTAVARRQVEDAVAVEIARDDARRAGIHCVVGGIRKRAVAMSQENRDGVARR